MPSEVSRILALPFRGEIPGDAVPRLTQLLRTPHGTQTLRPIQAASLLEAYLQHATHPERGIFVRAGVGSGKTLIGLLLPRILPPPRLGMTALYLCRANLRDKTLRELPEYCQHWGIPREYLAVRSYEELSADPDMLRDLRVYLVICDECQALKRLSSARTRRVRREARRDESIVWCMMSATSATKSIQDSAHLYALSLRDGSPLPLEGQELEAWARCTDSRCTAEPSDWGMVRPLVYGIHPAASDLWEGGGLSRVRASREAIDLRSQKTPGVLTHTELDVDSELVLHRITFPCPSEILEALGHLVALGEVPGSGGAACLSPSDVARSADQLSQGVYYRWAWEKTSAGEPDKSWLLKRRDWGKALTEYLAPGGQGERSGIDTPGQVIQSMRSMPRAVRVAWAAWEPVRHQYRVSYPGEGNSGAREPIPVEPVWLTDKVLDRAVGYLTRGGGILWYKSKAVARELRRRGCRVVLAGEPFPWKNLQGDGAPVALSAYAHGEGHNFQAWDRMLFTCPGPAVTPAGAAIEQAIGRVHRSGNRFDKVHAAFWQHTESLRGNLETAIKQANFIQEVSGTKQRLLAGKWEDITYDV